jgi:hypothetical protein
VAQAPGVPAAIHWRSSGSTTLYRVGVLGFSVTKNPPPMTEMSPYRRVYAQHLDGYFRATRGEFDLIALPGGRTRLEGHTWYRNEMYPQVYWDVIADQVIEAIHRRVLEHVKRTVEGKQ